MTYIEHLDDKFDFGKFSGCTFGEVMDSNHDYIIWVVNNVSGRICVFCDSVIEEVRLIFPWFEISRSFETMRKMRLEQFESNDVLDTGDDDDSWHSDEFEPSTYERYSGSYAQDEMGYSDDDIDTIFDGDPDAYWNID